MPLLAVENVFKSFGDRAALQGISFTVEAGQVVAVLGPSGCGKSTLLNIIAGLEKADAGEIHWQGRSLAGVPAHRRGFGLMFQDYALFPHLSVEKNIAFGLSMLSLEAEKVRIRVAELIDLVGLQGFEKREVDSLSGGEQQRVALARSLAPRPRLLMLDEPLGALDRALRERLLEELRLILRGLDQTSLYVTHDQQEAFAISDRVVVMRAGRAEQIDPPAQIYRRPASPFVARFLGFENLLSGRIERRGDGWVLATDLGELPVPAAPPAGTGQSGILLIRPDAARVGFQQDGEPAAILQGVVQEQTFRGSVQRVWVRVHQTVLKFDFPTELNLPAPGEPIQLSLPAADFQVYWDDT